MLLVALALGGLGSEPVVHQPRRPSPELFASIPRALPADGSASLSYTYAEVGAIALSADDIQGEEEDVDIYYVKGSIGLELFHVFASYENQSTDVEDTTTDLYKLGAGAHLALGNTLHAIAEIAWLYSDAESDLDSLADENHGYETRIGGRWAILDSIELAASVVSIDVDNRLASDDDGTGFEAGARWHFMDMLSIGAAYTILGDDEQIAANVRLQF
jgi:hypothetical protein